MTQSLKDIEKNILSATKAELKSLQRSWIIAKREFDLEIERFNLLKRLKEAADEVHKSYHDGFYVPYLKAEFFSPDMVKYISGLEKELETLRAAYEGTDMYETIRAIIKGMLFIVKTKDESQRKVKALNVDDAITALKTKIDKDYEDSDKAVVKKKAEKERFASEVMTTISELKLSDKEEMEFIDSCKLPKKFDDL